MAITHPHDALRAMMLDDSGVTAITSTITPWMLWRTDTLPAVTYQSILQTGEWTYDEALAYSAAEYQFVCWSKRLYGEAHDLATAISVVDGKHDEQHGNVYVHSVRVGDVADLENPPEQGKELPPYGVRVDIRINYERTS